jgi:hypothetical protein
MRYKIPFTIGAKPATGRMNCHSETLVSTSSVLVHEGEGHYRRSMLARRGRHSRRMNAHAVPASWSGVRSR